MNNISIILKVTDYCNLKCSFCRYTLQTNKNPMQMDIELAKKCIYKAAIHNISQKVNYLHIIFHGGEPLLWGKENFIDVFRFEDEFVIKYPNFKFYNSIQTNATMLDYEYIELFKKYNVSIGVSVDGPESINFHKASIDIANKIALLNEMGANYGILSVITNSHKDKAKDYYEFVKLNKIKSVGLCYCFDPIGEGSVSNDVLSSFLIELFELYFYGEYKFRIREFDCVIKNCLGRETHNCNFQCRENCGKFFSVFPNGYVYFCDAYEYKGDVLGSIKEKSFSDILSSEKLKEILQVLERNYMNNCRNCTILDLCGGACFRNDMQDGKNYFCQTYFEVYMYIKAVVNKYRKEENE